MEAGRNKPQVLVVDDDAESCRALSELLAAEGFVALAFEGGEAAWRAVTSRQIRPDVAVLDVRMPGLNGVALLRRIKTEFPALPVILVSAFPDEAVWSEALRAGATDVFPKPVHGASLVRALQAACGGRAHGSPVGDNPDPRAAGITTERRET